jgi:hypothetical protein
MKDLRGVDSEPPTSNASGIAGFLIVLFLLAGFGYYAYRANRPPPSEPPVVSNAELPSPSPPLVPAKH